MDDLDDDPLQPAPRKRQFWSERQGRGPKVAPLSLELFRRLVFNTWDGLQERGFFQESFGYWCVDSHEPDNWEPGGLGRDQSATILRRLGRANMWPYRANEESYDVDALYDMIEFLHDSVSEPAEGTHHSYSNCGWHYTKFRKRPGQRKYRDELNDVLSRADPPANLRDDGHIVIVLPQGYENLLAANVPEGADRDVAARISEAVRLYRASRTRDDLRHAVRDLADVFERLRPLAKQHLMKDDEAALFVIANKFGIRHLKDAERTDYSAAWLSWIFYVYLASAHLLVRLVEASETADMP